jgi:hypothetical protein
MRLAFGPHRPARPGRQGRVDAPPGLDAGFLIGAEHVLVHGERLAVVRGVSRRVSAAFA